MKSSRKTRKHRQTLRQLLVQPLESRVVLAASMGWDGAGQGSAELTYYIANHPSSLTQAETNAAIESALDAWSSVADIKFTPTNTPGLKDSLDFSFSSIDGVSRTLAQSYFPDDVNSARLAGDVQFDSAESWEVGNANGNRAFDLTYVAAHEIGHALGLDHSSASGSVMNDSASPSMVFNGLSSADETAILRLYAAADASDSTSDSDTTGTDTTGTDTTDSSSSDDTTTTDTDAPAFPRSHWRHGGSFEQFGSRFDASRSFNHNVYQPADVNGDSRVSPSDAISVINVLGKRVDFSSLDWNNLGLVDVSGDGSLSPTDAIIVINAMSNQRVTVIIVSANNTSGEDASTDDSESTSSDGSSSDSDSTDSESTDDDSTVSTDSGSTDSGTDDSGSTDGSDTESTDGSDDRDCPHDDESGDSSGETTTTDAESTSTGTSIGTNNINRMLAWLNADNFVTRFDADSSGSLTESEVPEHMWQLLVDSNVDTDADSAISLSELQTAIATARQELFTSKDADSDGQLTSTEVSTRQWSSLSSADSDSSGGVSFEEFDAYLTSYAGTKVAGGHHHGRGPHHGGMGSPELWTIAADSLFADFDTDSDDTLTESELPTKIFDDLIGKSVDTNSDGSISKDELTAAIAAARETYFTSKDADADGQLTSTEVGERTWRRISSADTNSDVTVSLDELKAWTPTLVKCPVDSSSSTPDSTTTDSTTTDSETTSTAGNTTASIFGRIMGRMGHRR